MSLYVFITRKPNPTADEGPPISESEWQTLVSSQEDFRAPTPDEQLQSGLRRNPQLQQVIWQRSEGSTAWFTWLDGQVAVKSVDEPIVVRMQGLAKKLSARVVSETGEMFDTTGAHAGFESWSEYYVPPKKSSFLARWFGRRKKK